MRSADRHARWSYAKNWSVVGLAALLLGIMSPKADADNDPFMGSTSVPNGAVLPGQSVTDTAAVVFASSGTVTFFLCRPNQVTVGQGCVSGGMQVGAAKPGIFVPITDTLVATSDAASGADTAALGTYCWRAEYSGDDTFNVRSHTDATSECFTVVQPPPPQGNAIPTLSEWAMIVLAGLLVLFAGVALHRRSA